jgi:hypothetical protein
MIQEEKITFDLNNCRTERTGASDVFFCLSEKQNLVCGCSLYFGYRRICGHSQRKEFAESHPRDKPINPSI